MENQADISQILKILKQIPIFATLDEKDHQAIIQRVVLMYYPADYLLFSKGDQGDKLFLIKRGQIEIFLPPKEEGDLPKTRATLQAGDFFGEMSLVTEQTRNSSAKTTTEAELFILTKEDFKTLINTNNHLAQQISSTMIERLKENDRENLI